MFPGANENKTPFGVLNLNRRALPFPFNSIFLISLMHPQCFSANVKVQNETERSQLMVWKKVTKKGKKTPTNINKKQVEK